MKRMILLFLAAAVMLPIKVGATPPPPRPPESWQSSPISLPFPMVDAPIGISSASLLLSWGENANSGTSGGTPYYPFDYSADYTIRYSGNEPETVEIAVPVLDIQNSVPDILVDGKAVESAMYVALSPIKYPDSNNADEWYELSIEDFIGDIRVQSKPYHMRNINADTPAKLYTIAQEGADDTHIGFELTLGYNPEKTTLLINAPFDMTPKTDYLSSYIDDEYNKKGYFYGMAYTVQFDRPEPFEVLVIGDDTLTWTVHEQSKPDSSGGSFLRVSTPKSETPREFIMRAKNECAEFFHYFPYPVEPDDFLLRWVDRLLDIQSDMPSNVPHSFANVRCIRHTSASRSPGYCSFGYDRPKYLFEQQTFVVAIPFNPGEEHILSVSYRPNTGMIWNKEQQQSLFYCLILTEPAGYWSFFDSLSVETNHPADTTETVLSSGFGTNGNYSVLKLNQPPNENFHIGFRLPDVREEPPADGIFGFPILFYIALGYWPVTLLIIILIVILIRKIIRCKRVTQSSDS